MGLIYKVEDAILLKTRNEIFKEAGISTLLANGFMANPYQTSLNGELNRNNRGYNYQFSRLSQEKYLERIEVLINNDDKSIQIFVNVFDVKSNLDAFPALSDLAGADFSQLAFRLTRMRLRDNYIGPSLFNKLFFPAHELGTFYTERGFNKKAEKLKKLIKSDIENLDGFIEKWKRLFSPMEIELKRES